MLAVVVVVCMGSIPMAALLFEQIRRIPFARKVRSISMETVSSALITAEMLAPITAAVTDTIPVVLPVGMAIMGAFVAVKIVPSLISRFIG